MTDAIETAVLLVAGTGSRLRPLTNEVPKALVQVNGRSMLERAVVTLRERGVRRFVFATGYRQEAVRAAAAALGIDACFCHNQRFDVTQNSISLLRCCEAVSGKSFYKLDGDVLFDVEIIARLAGGSQPLAVAVDGVRPLDMEAMKVVVSADGLITRFGKEIPVAEAQGESIGIERIDASVADLLFNAIRGLEQRGIVGRYYEDVYSELISSKLVSACAVQVGDLPWAEIDDNSDLARASARFV